MSQPSRLLRTVFAFAALAAAAPSQTVIPFGFPCPGSNASPSMSYSGSSQLGATLNVDLASGPGNAPAALLLGTKGPLNLGPFGAPQCWLWLNPFATVPVTLTATGTMSIAIPMPVSLSAVGIVFNLQWANFDPPANALGVTTTSALFVIVSP